MNRRNAIKGVLLFTGGSLVTISGYEWHALKKSPDLDYLKGQKNLLASLAECIIPATEVPGAKKAAVEDFMIVMVRDCTPVESQNRFIDGLKQLEKYCHSQYNRSFVDCSSKEKERVLKYFEQKGNSSKGFLGKVENKFLGQSFFVTLRKYTVIGYCTSEVGATQGLAYDPIPGKYKGCMALYPHQKAWATK
jgi:hypothetical protein